MFETNYNSLSLASFGPATLDDSKRREVVLNKRDSFDPSDIEGTRFVNKHERFANKYNTVEPPISGSTSKVLSKSRNVRDNTLYIDDIEGTRRKVKDRMARTNRHVDPLQPQYELPRYVATEPVIPKFVRDEFLIDDIEGTRSKPLYPNRPKDILSVNDIEGAKADWKPLHQRVRKENPPIDTLRSGEVSAKCRYIDKTFRCTDNLDPAYHIHGEDVADDSKYTKPKPTKQFIPGNRLLQTEDIPGATAGWKEKMVERREIRNINYTGDIQGAQADTVKHSIRTNRETHPLMPAYQSLDDGSVMPGITAPLLPASLIKTPTIRSKSASGTQGPPGTMPSPSPSNFGRSPSAPRPSSRGGVVEPPRLFLANPSPRSSDPVPPLSLFGGGGARGSGEGGGGVGSGRGGSNGGGGSGRGGGIGFGNFGGFGDQFGGNDKPATVSFASKFEEPGDLFGGFNSSFGGLDFGAGIDFGGNQAEEKQQQFSFGFDKPAPDKLPAHYYGAPSGRDGRSGSGGTPQRTSGGGNTSARAPSAPKSFQSSSSPASSARRMDGGIAGSAADRRAAKERQDEINSVRML